MTLTTTLSARSRGPADRGRRRRRGNATRCVTSWATPTSRRPMRCSACSPSTRWRGDARSSGHKIGLTSPAVQQQLGVDQPDSGVLFADMQVATGATVATGTLLQPKVEAEIAFILAEDLDGDLSESRIRAAAGVAIPAIEIVDSRVQDWSISIVDTIADNGSSALFVLGSEVAAVADLDFASRTMRLTRDGGVVSAGRGSELPGQSAQRPAVAGSHRARYGAPLRAGDIVLSGALGPMVPVRPGSTYVAEIGGLGSSSFFRRGGRMTRTKVAIIGSGNIGTDLMIKMLRRVATRSRWPRWSASIRPPTGCARARRLGVATTARRRRGLLDMPEFDDIAVVFDATSAGAHARQRRGCWRPRQAAHRPDPGRDRPVRGAGGQPRRASGAPATSTW